MAKIFSKILLIFLFLVVSFIGFFSLVGFETKSFNKQIKENLKKVDKNLDVRLNDVKNVFGLIKFVFKKPAFQLDEVVEDLVNLGEAYRKDRKDLEQAAEGVHNRFLKDGITFIVQGTPLEDLRTMMETREEYRERREQNEAGLMKTLGTYSPAFGMVGTLMEEIYRLGD